MADKKEDEELKSFLSKVEEVGESNVFSEHGRILPSTLSHACY